MITDDMLLCLGIDEDSCMAVCRHIKTLTVQERPVPIWMCMSCGEMTASCFDIADQMAVNEFMQALR